jgi:hypothetical protein
MNDETPKEEQKRTVEQEIERELEIDETKLAEELQRQPSRFFYYASAWARAQRKFRQAKLGLEALEAATAKKFRAECEANKVKSTVDMVKDHCTLDEEVAAERGALIQAEYVTEMLEVAKQAFRQRATSLVELKRTRSEEEFYSEKGMERMQEEIDRKRGRKGPKDLK